MSVEAIVRPEEVLSVFRRINQRAIMLESQAQDVGAGPAEVPNDPG